MDYEMQQPPLDHKSDMNVDNVLFFFFDAQRFWDTETGGEIPEMEG